MSEDATERAGLSTALAWAGVGVLLVLAFVHAMTGREPFPGWDVDPWLNPPARTGLPASWEIGVDALAVLASAAVVAAAALARRRVRLWAVGLWALGALGVLGHRLLHPGGVGLEHLIAGSPWIAATAAGVAALHLKPEGGPARVAAALAIGFAVMLLAKGAHQVAVEHPATVRSFEAGRAERLAAQGWEEDSATARSFERRLRQPEATGWFGLSNVTASFAAASAVGLGFAGVAGARRLTREKRWKTAAGLAGGAAAAVALLFLTGSKGGLGAAAMGAGGAGLGLVAARLAPERRWIGPAIGVGVSVVVLGLVAARGWLGSSWPSAESPERSVLFRWHYVTAAVRIAAEHPALGVGPDGFRQAYLLAKPAENPEAVTSPHSVVFDWASTLGVFGVAWVGLLVGLAAGVGRGLWRACAVLNRRAAGGAGCGDDRRLVQFGLLIAVVGTLLAGLVEFRTATPEMGVLRLVGLAGWLAVAGCWIVLARADEPLCRWVRVGLAGAGLALLTHFQIEMTPVLPGAATLAFLLVGLAAGGQDEQAGARAGAALSKTDRLGLAGGGGVACAAVVMLGLGGMNLSGWEAAVRPPAERVAGVGVLERRLRAAAEGRAGPTGRVESVASVRAEIETRLAGTLSTAASDDLRALDPLSLLRYLTEVEAAEALSRAAGELRPGHVGTWREASRRRLVAAQVAAGSGLRDLAGQEVDLALATARRAVDVRHTASAHAWLGSAARGGAVMLEEAGGDPAEVAALLRDAIDAWARASELDPHGITHPLRLMEVSETMGERERAANWAAEALERDRVGARLDPEIGLTASQRARAEALASSGSSGGP